MSFLKKLIAKILLKKVSKLDKLYQRHAGEECYIFGDGISIKWMDLEQFKNRPAITGSFMVYHKDFKKLNVPYNAIIEPNWFWPIFPYGGFKKLRFLRHKTHAEYRKTIKESPSTLFFINVSNFPVTRFINSLYVSRWYKPPFEFKNPFSEREDTHDGSFKFQVSLAIFLGFKKAYLIGQDYTHNPSKSLHFYEKGEGVWDEKKNFNKEFIDYAKQYIDLVTVTVDAKSETMESITYKELTGKDPVFRENTDLVDRVKLESLATWHGYTIF